MGFGALQASELPAHLLLVDEGPQQAAHLHGRDVVGHQYRVQAEEVVGMVVVNDELLQNVSGGLRNGYFYTISAECWGFSCNLNPY